MAGVLSILNTKKRKDCALCLDEFWLELFIDMLLIFEKDIQGGFTQVVKRYPKDNNKHMKDEYNPDEKSTYLHLQYLHGKSPSGVVKLLIHGFE